jgi:hypothetical protein
MEYGKVLSRAWEITWRWKVLWILGFLAALGSGGGGGGGSSYSGDTNQWGYTFQRVPTEIWVLIAGIACLAILIGIAIWVISVIARGGLIAGVQQVEEEGSTTFGSAWRVGVKRFWTLFGISVLTALPILILVVVGIVVFALLIAGTVGAVDRAAEIGGAIGGITLALCGGVFCCGMVILGIVLDQIRKYAERAAILEGLGWIDAFKRGWEVLKNNIGPTLVFWFIFLVIGLVLVIFVGGGAFVVAAPLAAIFSNTNPGAWVIAPLCCGGLLAFIIFALIGSIVETFTSATWTLAYREMTGLATKIEAPVVEPAAEEE